MAFGNVAVASVATHERNMDRTMTFLRRKQTGSFYTADSLTTDMMNELVESLTTGKRERIYELRFLEPCVGAGSFVFAYLNAVQLSDLTVNNTVSC